MHVETAPARNPSQEYGFFFHEESLLLRLLHFVVYESESVNWNQTSDWIRICDNDDCDDDAEKKVAHTVIYLDFSSFNNEKWENIIFESIIELSVSIFKCVWTKHVLKWGILLTHPNDWVGVVLKKNQFTS